MKISEIRNYLPTEASYRARNGLKPDTAQVRLEEFKELETLNQKGLLGTLQDYRGGDLGSELLKDQLHFLRHPAASISPQDLSHIYDTLLKTPKDKRRRTYSKLAKKLGYTCITNNGGDKFWIRPNRKKEFVKGMGTSNHGQSEARQLKYEVREGLENSGCFNFMTLFKMRPSGQGK